MIVFDIETLRCTDADVIEQMRLTIKPPATHKKAETISAWMEENAASALDELVSKTSFDGALGSIACIAWAVNDEVLSTLPTDNEGDVIQKLYDAADKASINFDDTVCGHNIVGFDLPFLKHRSVILRIKPPAIFMKAMTSKPWDSCIQDTMLMWSSDPHKRGSMDKLCKAFGIAGKGDFDGSMVNAEWTTGSREKVIAYCKLDVERTREIYKRITFA